MFCPARKFKLFKISNNISQCMSYWGLNENCVFKNKIAVIHEKRLATGETELGVMQG